jgi:hypothetical protein
LCEECLDTVETEHNGHVVYHIENAAKEIRKQTETKIASLKEQIDKARKQSMNLINIGLALQKSVTAVEKHLIWPLI